MIKAFLFDYDGVITKGGENDRIFKTLATNLAVPQKTVSDWLLEIWRPYMKGQLTEEQVWEHLEQKFGKPIPVEKRGIWFTWEELTPLPEMLALVSQLKQAGYVVGILSNVFQQTVAILEQHHVYDAFDFRVVSSETGYAKPDKEIFAIALEKAGNLLPEEAVFLDDRQSNVDTATELGISSVLVNEHDTVIEAVKSRVNI